MVTTSLIYVHVRSCIRLMRQYIYPLSELKGLSVQLLSAYIMIDLYGLGLSGGAW